MPSLMPLSGRILLTLGLVALSLLPVTGQTGVDTVRFKATSG
jgi:hypothetical protein